MPKRRQSLYLVDGMSHIFRAYYAIRGLSTSAGLATNAIYGFTMMLRKVLEAEQPDHVAVVLDSAAPTFRHESFADYKATRGPMPDDLASQLPFILRVCEAFRIPVIRMDRFEADDLIGTLARQGEAAGLDVVLVTQDKDLCQLVTERTTILRDERDRSVTRIDRDGVIARMGVPPEQVVDLLGLQGDSSDNIPGAPGIGEKGAVQIIAQFGSIDAALAGWEEVKRKTYRESLRDNADIIRTSRELATIKTDCPVNLDLESLRLELPDRAAAHALFRELEFNTLAREFVDAAVDAPATGSTAPASDLGRFTSVATLKDIKRFLDSLFEADTIAVVPAAGVDGTIHGVAFSSADSVATFVDLDSCDDAVAAFEAVSDLLSNGLVSKVVHDWKGCLHVLNDHLERLDPKRAKHVAEETSRCGGSFPWKGAVRLDAVAEDTMLSAYLVDATRTKYLLSDLAREHGGREVMSPLEGYESAPAVALRSAAALLRVSDSLRARLDREALSEVYTTMELPLVELLYEIERTGLLVDTKALADIAVSMEARIIELEARIHELAGGPFNVGSPAQLGEVLDRLNIGTTRKTATGKMSTSRDVLEELAQTYELPKLVIEYREVTKLKGTYVDALPTLIDKATGRVHTTMNQAVTATGRLSSSNPNLQNIPVRTEAGREIRRAFVAAPGCAIVSADYSQIELRVLAHVTSDRRMTEAFRVGEDIHAETARAVFGAASADQEKEKRRLAKIVNFAIAYNVGAFGLAQRTGLSRKEAKAAIDAYYASFSGVRRYMEETPDNARETGHVVTIFGRRRTIPDLSNKNHNLRARAEREAINMPIQGTAADLMKLAMIRVRRALERDKLPARILMQVHDELLLETPADRVDDTIELLRREMESVYELDVPLVVDVGSGANWLDAK